MDQPFVGAIFMTGANFAPSGWSLCQGQLLSIADNETLFTLLGTTYGGDGVQTFGLPDLRGRMSINQGTGLGLSPYVMGQMGGTEQVTLTSATMPQHTHLVNITATATTNVPSSSVYISGAAVSGNPINVYSTNSATAQLAANTIGLNGGGLPFSIIQPVLAVNYIIALFGIYPSQN